MPNESHIPDITHALTVKDVLAFFDSLPSAEYMKNLFMDGIDVGEDPMTALDDAVSSCENDLTYGMVPSDEGYQEGLRQIKLARDFMSKYASDAPSAPSDVAERLLNSSTACRDIASETVNSPKPCAPVSGRKTKSRQAQEAVENSKTIPATDTAQKLLAPKSAKEIVDSIVPLPAVPQSRPSEHVYPPLPVPRDLKSVSREIDRLLELARKFPEKTQKGDEIAKALHKLYKIRGELSR